MEKIPEPVLMLWTLGNAITAFAIAQSVIFGYVTLQEYWLRKLEIGYFPWVVFVMLGVGIGLEWLAVWWCHSSSLKLELWPSSPPSEHVKHLFCRVFVGRVVCVLLFGLLSLVALWGPVIDKHLAAKPGVEI